MNSSSARASQRAQKHYLDAERQGREITARWLAHPATKPIILRYRNAAAGILDTPPVDRFTTDQESVTRFTLAALRLQPVHVDGHIEPGVLDPQSGWQMTPHERERASATAHHWGALLTIVAANMADAGVPIRLSYTHCAGDRRYRGDLIALGELLALPIDLDLDPEYIVGELINTNAPMEYGHADRQLVIRDQRPATVDRTAMAIQRHLIELASGHSTFPQPRTPDPAERATPAEHTAAWIMQARHRALLAAHALFPDKFTVPNIFTTWHARPTTVGGAVREAMETEMNPGVPAERRRHRAQRPDERTLRRDLQKLGLNATGRSGEKT